MKKLGKLTISLNKVIKNEELVNLRGGYDDGGGYNPEDLAQITCYSAHWEVIGCVNTPYCPDYYGQKAKCTSKYSGVHTANCANGAGWC